MGLDPELLKQLVITFKSELEEQVQVITDGLLKLEKLPANSEEQLAIIEEIFRSAHNIKGASRGLGINDIGEIAHKVENIFSAIQKKLLILTPEVINICLEAIDKMQMAMTAYINKTNLSFDLADLLKRLEQAKEKETENLISDNKPLTLNQPSVEVRKTETLEKNKYIPESVSHESIRVGIENIDKVAALMEEVQVNKLAIEDHYNELTSLTHKNKQFSYIWKQILNLNNSSRDIAFNESMTKLHHLAHDHFLEVSESAIQLQKSMRTQLNELSILSNSLQEEIRMLRLIPAQSLLRTFPRYVRDLALDLHKDVECEIHGDDVKMDKMVLQGLKDPIMHILRNSVDHGIENPDIRQALGKPKSGKITIDVVDLGNQIMINIVDDGAGIDINNIAAQAEQCKLVTSSEVEGMGEKEILDLIFRSGFTTKNVITEVSGRGVGLDVVKANLIELKGSVTVSTILGQGTTFSLYVPLTLSSERGLLVNCANQVFVFPTHAVERVLVVNPVDILDINGNQALLIENHPVPVRILADALGMHNPEKLKKDKFPIVVIKKGRHTVAFLVDEIINEREIVIKPLRAPLADVQCVAGGTLLERNQVAVVLNSTDLINQALHITAANRIAFQETVTATQERPHILVVDDSITTRTLEKNILESRDYQVTISVNGKEAWDLLQKNKFSLLITDVSMPIMDGFTLTEHVKKSEHLRNMPVIIVTSLGSEAEKSRGIEVGADAYIVKSEFESGLLLDLVAQLV